MKCTILHECPGRLRIHAAAPAMSLRQADILEAYLKKTSGVEGVKVYDRTGDAVIRYTGSREAVLRALSVFSYDKAEALAPEHSSRELNRERSAPRSSGCFRAGRHRCYGVHAPGRL